MKYEYEKTRVVQRLFSWKVRRAYILTINRVLLQAFPCVTAFWDDGIKTKTESSCHKQLAAQQNFTRILCASNF